MISECWWCEKPYEYTGEALNDDELDVCPTCTGDPGFNEVLERQLDIIGRKPDCVPLEEALKRYELLDTVRLLTSCAFVAGFAIGAAVAFVLSTLK